MEQLGFAGWLSLLSAAGVMVALVSNLRGMRVTDEQKAAELSEMRSDIKHIRGQVDKNDVLMADVREQLDEVRDRVTRVEESTKSAHKRMDKLEETEG
jgi:septation ring formation regulator EzrA